MARGLATGASADLDPVDTVDATREGREAAMGKKGGADGVALGEAYTEVADGLEDIGFGKIIGIGDQQVAIGGAGVEHPAGVVHEIVIGGDGPATGAKQGGGTAGQVG